jgi:DNA-binding CsgD family transcriptional regulator
MVSSAGAAKACGQNRDFSGGRKPGPALAKSGLAALKRIFDATEIALFLVDEEAQVQLLTRAAEDLLERSLLVLDGGRLKAHSPAHTAQLRRAIRWPVHADLELAYRDSLLVIETDRLEVAGCRSLVLLQCKPQLKEWSLTNSEAVIAEALLLGMSLPEIAARRGRALSTVKSQAKAIYAKAGVKGQLDFIFKHRSSLRALKEAHP